MLVYAFLFALALLLVSLYLRSSSSVSKRSSTGPQTILLVGPLASGKTAIFSNLLYGYTPQTHTSMKENEGAIKTRWMRDSVESGSLEKEVTKEEKALIPRTIKRPLHLVDIPGHSRLRTRALAQYISTADGIVYTVDGVSGLTGKNIQEAGEHLHVLLSLLSLLSAYNNIPPPPLLVLLTKSDLFPKRSTSTSAIDVKAHSQLLDRAKQSFAREMERRRISATSATTSAGARLEGLEAIASSSSSTSATSILKNIWKTISGEASGSTISQNMRGLPSDEAEILLEDAFPFEGTFDWDKLGVDITWAVGSAKGGPEGLDGIWEWVERI